MHVIHTIQKFSKGMYKLQIYMDAYVIHTKRYIIYNTYIRELIHPLIILKVPSLIIIDHNFYLNT